MSELADRTQQPAGTLTGIIDRLIEDGLVEWACDASDRRVVHVALTLSGNEWLARLAQARCEDMERILARFSDQQLKQMDSLFRLFLQAIYDLLRIASLNEQGLQ